MPCFRWGVRLKNVCWLLIQCWEFFFFCYSICFGFLLCVLFLFLVFALFYLLRVACNVHLNLIWNHFNFKQVMIAFQSSPFRGDATSFNKSDATKRGKKHYICFYMRFDGLDYLLLWEEKKCCASLLPHIHRRQVIPYADPSWKRIKI